MQTGINTNVLIDNLKTPFLAVFFSSHQRVTLLLESEKQLKNYFPFLFHSDKDILIVMDIAAVAIILIAIFLTLCGLAKSHRSKCVEITASLLFILASKFNWKNRM